jgi:hypothetical protein
MPSAVLNAVPEKDHDGNCDNDGNDATDEKITLIALGFHISQNDQTRAALPRPRQEIPHPFDGTLDWLGATKLRCK